MNRIKKGLGIFLITLTFAVLLSLPAMAAGYFDDTTIENGKFVNLNTEHAAEYTYVTLENYNNGLNVSDINLENNTFTAVTNDTVFTENGIICVRLKKTSDERKFFYIMGKDGLERSDAGFKGQGEDEVYTYIGTPIGASFPGWVPGVWTHPHSFYVKLDGTPLYMSAHTHISETLPQNIEDQLNGDTINDPGDTNGYRAKAENAVESIFYRYTYESHEILPVEELQTITFDVSVRQGSLTAYSPSGIPLKTKLVLYTMNETGNVTAYSWTDTAPCVNEGSRTRHTSVQGKRKNADLLYRKLCPCSLYHCLEERLYDTWSSV